MRKIFGNIASTFLALAVAIPLAINASQPTVNNVANMGSDAYGKEAHSDSYNEATELLRLDDEAREELITAGFVFAGNNDELAAEIIDYATNYLGRPYHSGGKGPKAFDCSGFTSYVFRNYDIALSPSSSGQYTQGVKIDTDEIRPGDLLFFGGRAGGKNVGHVALAVDVDDDGTVTFIHAATNSGIRYDRYPDDGYYSRRYIGARRVLE